MMAAWDIISIVQAYPLFFVFLIFNLIQFYIVNHCPIVYNVNACCYFLDEHSHIRCFVNLYTVCCAK